MIDSPSTCWKSVRLCTGNGIAMSIEWASGTRGDSYPELSRGTTQTGVRLYNERLILSLVRLHGQLPKGILMLA